MVCPVDWKISEVGIPEGFLTASFDHFGRRIRIYEVDFLLRVNEIKIRFPSRSQS